jgi:hypothetical protein
VSIATTILFASGAWTAAHAREPGLECWPLVVTVVCSLWSIWRTSRSWFLTVTKWWGHLDDVPLVTPNWSVEIPFFLAAAFALAALAMLGRRLGSRELVRACAVAGAVLVLAEALRVAVPDLRLLVGAGFLAGNLTAARAYRSARLTLDRGLPRARVR